MDQPPVQSQIDPQSQRRSTRNKPLEAAVLGSVCGGVVGLLAVIACAAIIPTPSGPNFAAAAMLAPFIQIALVMSLFGSLFCGALGGLVRPFGLAVAVAVVLGLFAGASMFSLEPLGQIMLPPLFTGFAFAVFAGAGVRSAIERQD